MTNDERDVLALGAPKNVYVAIQRAFALGQQNNHKGYAALCQQAREIDTLPPPLTETPQPQLRTGEQEINAALAGIKAREAAAFQAVIKWSDLLRVTEQEPLLLRDVAGLQKRLELGPITLVELLRWQRDKYDMRV